MDFAKQCDVCVIGGGPSGTTAAALLSKKGYDVLLLERAHHPRYAVGESLIPHFWRYIDSSGALEAIAEEGFVEKAGGTVCWKNAITNMAFKDFGYNRPALHVERDCFDNILLENARRQGVRVVEGVNVNAVTLDGDEGVGVRFRTDADDGPGEITCRYMIDATGQKSLVSSLMGTRELDEDFRFCSIWGYFENSRFVGPNGVVHDCQNLMNPPPTTFVTSVGEQGWSWHIPLRKSTSVGFVVPTAEFRKLRTDSGSLESTFLRMCETTPILNRLLETARLVPDSVRVIRDYSYRSRQLSFPRCFLIGDAAAFIDPIFSIGVVLGMYSATVATWAIDRSMRSGDAADHYRAIYDNQLSSRLDLARSLALPAYIENPDRHANILLNQLAFESQTEKALCSVVSKITDRSSNYTTAAASAHAAEVESRFRRLDAISW